LVDWDRTKYRLHQSQPPWFFASISISRWAVCLPFWQQGAVVGQQLYETKMNSMSSTAI
jgi:hypothetical protein